MRDGPSTGTRLTIHRPGSDAINAVMDAAVDLANMDEGYFAGSPVLLEHCRAICAAVERCVEAGVLGWVDEDGDSWANNPRTGTAVKDEPDEPQPVYPTVTTEYGVHTCDETCPTLAGGDWPAMARHHVRTYFAPESYDLMTSDREIMTHYARSFAREARKAAAPPKVRPPTPVGPREYPEWPQAAGAPARGFYLYRLWAAGDRLLYVGVSTCLSQRLRAHRRKWENLITHISWTEHPDAASMLEAEAVAIRDENPALNKAGVE